MFKENDKIKVKQYCSGSHPNVVYTLKKSGNRLSAFNNDGIRGCSCTDNWILVSTKKINVRNLNKDLIKGKAIATKVAK